MENEKPKQYLHKYASGYKQDAIDLLTGCTVTLPFLLLTLIYKPTSLYSPYVFVFGMAITTITLRFGRAGLKVSRLQDKIQQADFSHLDILLAYVEERDAILRNAAIERIVEVLTNSSAVQFADIGNETRARLRNLIRRAANRELVIENPERKCKKISLILIELGNSEDRRVAAEVINHFGA